MHHIILYHPLRTIYSDILLRPGCQGPGGYNSAECSRNVPPVELHYKQPIYGESRNRSFFDLPVTKITAYFMRKYNIIAFYMESRNRSQFDLSVTKIYRIMQSKKKLYYLKLQLQLQLFLFTQLSYFGLHLL